MRRFVNLIALWTVVRVLSLQTAAGIMSNPANSSNASLLPPRKEFFKKKSYLKLDRPLWVLEDKGSHPGGFDVATHRPIQKKPFISWSSLNRKLPSHYLNLEQMKSSVASPRNSVPRQRTRIFPIFEDPDADPILIYRGPKAEMIFNSMMTKKRYPMKEPVPGQIMYPPYSPKFEKKSVVRKNSHNPFQNVTLIPFYPHEAIDPRQNKFGLDFEHLENTVPPEEADHHQAETENYLTQEVPSPVLKPRGCYHSYYSQNDVLSRFWSLPQTTFTEATTPMILARNVPIPNGIYSNHREEATTPMPRASEENLRIIYPTDVETVPPKRYKTVHSAKYGGFKATNPIYTLSKLMRFRPQKAGEKPAVGTSKATPPPEEDWKPSNFPNPPFSEPVADPPKV